MLKSDTKAINQFLAKGISNENIVLKSNGNQYYSFTYVADAIAGLLTVLFKGKCGEAYNISDDASDIKLKDLASLIATICNTKVVYDIPESTEAMGYSKVTKARLDNIKIKGLGWQAKYNIKSGIERTINILKNTVQK